MALPLVAGMIGSSLIGGAASMMGANKAGKAASSAADQQRNLSLQDLMFRQKMYEDEQRLYGPLRQRLVNEAMSDRPLGYDVTSGQIRRAYADQNRRALGLAYQMPGSGLMSNALQSGRLNLASDLANAYQRGMDARRQMGMAVAGGDKSAQLGMNYSQGLGNLSNFYGQQANQFNQAAAQGWQNFGQSLSGLAYALPYAMRGSQQQQTPLGYTGIIPVEQTPGVLPMTAPYLGGMPQQTGNYTNLTAGNLYSPWGRG